ncbi:hypothetical protein PIB30_103130, partial [Stylosanthes scabra]|nr:hypothetical protein [Stylosanthes scabra]
GTVPTLKWYYLIRCTCRIVAKRFAASLPEQNDPSPILGILVAPCDTSFKTSRHRLQGIRGFQTTTTKASPPERVRHTH